RRSPDLTVDVQLGLHLFAPYVHLVEDRHVLRHVLGVGEVVEQVVWFGVDGRGLLVLRHDGGSSPLRTRGGRAVDAVVPPFAVVPRLALPCAGTARMPL